MKKISKREGGKKNEQKENGWTHRLTEPFKKHKDNRDNVFATLWEDLKQGWHFLHKLRNYLRAFVYMTFK